MLKGTLRVFVVLWTRNEIRRQISLNCLLCSFDSVWALADFLESGQHKRKTVSLPNFLSISFVFERASEVTVVVEEVFASVQLAVLVSNSRNSGLFGNRCLETLSIGS